MEDTYGISDIIRKQKKCALLWRKQNRHQRTDQRDRRSRYFSTILEEFPDCTLLLCHRWSCQKNFAKECLPEFNVNNSNGAGAYVITTFVANRSGFDREGNPDNECGNGWGYYDLGLHNENVILKAKELGLDTLVMGIRDGEKIREMLDIPETEIIVAVIAVGYGADAPAKPKRKQADDILKFY